MIRCFIFLLILGFVSPQFIFEGSECYLQDGSAGECKPITECPEAFSQLRGRYGSSSKYSRCSFDKYTEIICCPVHLTTPPSKIETSDSIIFGTDEDNSPWNWQSSSTTVSDDSNTIIRLEQNKATQACENYIAKKPSSISLHIIGGENAGLGEFPHMVALGYYRTDGLQFDCGGALISERFILTAAHCVNNLEKILPTVARMGTVDVVENEENAETDYKIIKHIVHPNYKRPIKYHDIALLEIDRDADFSAILYPACVNTDPEDPSGFLSITGWGTTNIKKRSKSPKLQKANLSAVSLIRCNTTYLGRNWRRNLPTGLTEDQMCAVGNNDNLDSCDGDSGGPLQVMVDPNNSDTLYKVVGVTSFGNGCGGQIPAVYIRVSNYVEWIESIVWP